jgi:hypothetical protein
MKRLILLLAWPMGWGVSWILFWLGHWSWLVIAESEPTTPLQHLWFTFWFNLYQGFMHASSVAQDQATDPEHIQLPTRFFPWQGGAPATTPDNN